MGMIEALPFADLGTEPERCERVDPAQAPQPGDGVRAWDAGRELREVGFDLVTACDQHVLGRADKSASVAREARSANRTEVSHERCLRDHVSPGPSQ